MKNIMFNFALYSVEMLIAYMYESKLFSKKRSTIITLLIGEFFYLLISIFNVFYNNIILNIVAFFVVNVVILIVNYNISFRQTIIHITLLTAIMLVTECIVTFTISAILNIVFLTYKENFTILLIESSLSKILYTVFCFLLTKNKKYSNNSYIKTPLYLFIFPICSIVMLMLLIVISSTYNLPIILNESISVLSIILLVSVVSTYILHNSYYKKEKELFELRNELSKVETNKSYYQILEHQNEEMHSFSHNTKNHFQIIKSLANSKEVDDYIDKCYGELEKSSIFGKTNNKILDIIINKYSLLCEIKNIDFSVSVKTANLSYIKDNELSTLLSCILDNAVEAAEKTEHGRIEFNLNNQQFFDVLICINSCNYNPDFEKNILKTTKENAIMHGYGTKSIKKIVKSNKGTYTWKYDKNNNEFITTIIFNKES